MKKGISVLVIGMITLAVIGMFAAAENMNAETEDDLQEKVAPGVGGEVMNYVKKFVEKRGINADDVKNVSKVNFEDLPKEVNIENVNEANLAIYEIDYEEEEQDKQLFMVTYSLEELKAQGDLIIAHDKREFLNFGLAEKVSKSEFLNTAAGVTTSRDKGYVMMREGSITGISTSLEIVEGEGQMTVIIYKNGEAIGFGNSIVADSSGMKKDYDVQSKEVVTFEPGDIISAYVKLEGDVTWKDATTLVEITTIN